MGEKNRDYFLNVSSVLTGVNQSRVKRVRAEKQLYSSSILHLIHTSHKSTTAITKHIKRNPENKKNLDINNFIVLVKATVV